MVMMVHSRQRRLKAESHIAYISAIDTISGTNVYLRKMGDMEIAFLSNQLLLLIVGRPACRIARFPDDGSLLSLVSYVLKIALFIQENTSLISPRFHLRSRLSLSASWCAVFKAWRARTAGVAGERNGE